MNTWLTTKEAAKYLGCSTGTVRRWLPKPNYIEKDKWGIRRSYYHINRVAPLKSKHQKENRSGKFLKGYKRPTAQVVCEECGRMFQQKKGNGYLCSECRTGITREDDPYGTMKRHKWREGYKCRKCGREKVLMGHRYCQVCEPKKAPEVNELSLYY